MLMRGFSGVTGKQIEPRCRMDCRVKPGNDELSLRGAPATKQSRVARKPLWIASLSLAMTRFYRHHRA
jgi:hypothetical protein